MKTNNRLVVKVGSKVLTRKDGTIDVTRVSSLVDQIMELKKNGYDVILVSSGAVACGRSILKTEVNLDSVEQRQVFSAVGQVHLMDLYHTFFNNYGVAVGQVLTMKENFKPGIEYSNQKGCMEAMIRSGVMPVVNENDTVSITELMFTDNDELSGLVAEMMGVDGMVILSSIDGLYDTEGKVIRTVNVKDDINSFIRPVKSSEGRGGMDTKCHNALRIASKGIWVAIANGNMENVLVRLIINKEEFPYTYFIPEEK